MKGTAEDARRGDAAWLRGQLDDLMRRLRDPKARDRDRFEISRDLAAISSGHPWRDAARDRGSHHSSDPMAGRRR